MIGNPTPIWTSPHAHLGDRDVLVAMGTEPLEGQGLPVPAVLTPSFPVVLPSSDAYGILQRLSTLEQTVEALQREVGWAIALTRGWQRMRGALADLWTRFWRGED